MRIRGGPSGCIGQIFRVKEAQHRLRGQGLHRQGEREVCDRGLVYFLGRRPCPPRHEDGVRFWYDIVVVACVAPHSAGEATITAPDRKSSALQSAWLPILQRETPQPVKRNGFAAAVLPICKAFRIECAFWMLERDGKR